MLKRNLDTILIIAVAVLLTLQISSMFRKSPVNEQQIRNEVKLEYLQKELPEIKGELVVIKQKYDSLLSASIDRVVELENKKQPIKNAIKNVDIITDNFDKLQLERASREYYERYK